MKPLKTTFGIALAFGLTVDAQAQSQRSDNHRPPRPSEQEVHFKVQGRSVDDSKNRGRINFDWLRRKELEHRPPRGCSSASAYGRPCNHSPG